MLIVSVKKRTKIRKGKFYSNVSLRGESGKFTENRVMSVKGWKETVKLFPMYRQM